MEKFALTFPGITGQITPPPNVPSGGLFPSGAIGENIIRTGITVFLMIIVITALLYILWGGVRYIFSRGDKEKIKGAREKIAYSFIGLLVAFLAFLIINTFGNFFNVPLLGILPPGPTPIPTIATCPAPGNVACDSSLATITDIAGTWSDIPGDTGSYNYHIQACNFSNGDCSNGIYKPGDITSGNFGFVRDLTPNTVYLLRVRVESNTVGCSSPGSWSGNVTCSTLASGPTPTPLPPCPGACRDESIGCFFGETPLTPTVCDAMIGPLICCISGPTPTPSPTPTGTPIPTGTPVPTPTGTPGPTSTPTPTPLPTSTPTPKPTSTPTPTPTITPTPTLTPTPTPSCKGAGETCIFNIECCSNWCIDGLFTCSAFPGPFTISGFVWFDDNENGAIDWAAGEESRPGTEVTIVKPDSSAVTTITDSGGVYSFVSLTAGKYTVSFTVPDGYWVTTLNNPTVPPITLGPSQNVNFGIKFGSP